MDPVFEGLQGGPGTLIKYNPLSNVSSSEVWNFLRAMVRLHPPSWETQMCSMLLVLLMSLLLLSLLYSLALMLSLLKLSVLLLISDMQAFAAKLGKSRCSVSLHYARSQPHVKQDLCSRSHRTLALAMHPAPVSAVHHPTLCRASSHLLPCITQIPLLAAPAVFVIACITLCHFCSLKTTDVGPTQRLYHYPLTWLLRATSCRCLRPADIM